MTVTISHETVNSTKGTLAFSDGTYPHIITQKFTVSADMSVTSLAIYIDTYTAWEVYEGEPGYSTLAFTLGTTAGGNEVLSELFNLYSYAGGFYTVVTTGTLPAGDYWISIAEGGGDMFVPHLFAGIDTANGYGETQDDTTGSLAVVAYDLGFKVIGELSSSPPAQASNPSPANAATGVGKAALTLSWDTGSDETGQNVYFGQTGSMVLVSTNQPGHTFAVASSALTHNTEYSWRVDTINADGTTTGAVWTFTVAAFSPPADLVVLRFLVAAANGKLYYET
jgi:hypothetical protein